MSITVKFRASDESQESLAQELDEVIQTTDRTATLTTVFPGSSDRDLATLFVIKCARGTPDELIGRLREINRIEFIDLATKRFPLY